MSTVYEEQKDEVSHYSDYTKWMVAVCDINFFVLFLILFDLENNLFRMVFFMCNIQGNQRLDLKHRSVFGCSFFSFYINYYKNILR